MFLNELKRILVKAPLLFVLIFVFPVFIVSSFITGITKPEAIPDDLVKAAENAQHRLLNLPDQFNAWNEYDKYPKLLSDKWVIFGGQNDTVSGSAESDAIIGKYYNFYHTNINSVGGETTLRNTYSAARSAFLDFYDTYTDCLINSIRVFITQKNYKTLIKNIDALYNELKYEESHYTNVNLLDEARRRCNDIRNKTNFNKIIIQIHPMSLTQEQSNNLNSLFNDINVKRYQQFEIPVNTNDRNILLRYIDFCDISYKYLTYHTNIYHTQNSSSSEKYFGFSEFNTDKKRAEILRIEYLLNNGKASFDYSRPFEFMSVMHTPSGSLRLDFIYNNLEMITAFLALLSIIITVFCIFDDIKKKTIIGTIASQKSRYKIIWSKLMACYAAIFIAVGLFTILYFVASMLIIAPASAPPVLFVLFGKHVLTVSALTYFCLFMTVLLMKLLFVASLTALICLSVKNKIIVLTASVAIIALILIADYVLRGFLIYQFTIIPIFVISSAMIIHSTILKFKKRDF